VAATTPQLILRLSDFPNDCYFVGYICHGVRQDLFKEPQLRGEVVIVRTFGGKPAQRRVWDVGDTVVYLTNEDQFALLIAGKPALEPIGFPKEDVFCLPANKSTRKPFRWAQLIPWQNW
jgi:hypothetical protein